ncbi:MAG: DUF2953 domain-containing protein [Gracilibacteraceae bacterium]|jgi:hypothetical protein|nr:DUF2953 domain-containing protein [Gracilibacteraceae bacterium]
MHGLALLCALMFWILAGFFFCWKIRLHIIAEDNNVRVEVACGLPAKAGAVFELSPASFQGITSDIKSIMNGMKAKTEKTEKPEKTEKTEKTLAKKAAPKRGVIRSVHVLWARISILLALRRRIRGLLFALTRKMEVQTLRVSVGGGTGDAAQTALISGGIWMAWGALTAHLLKRVRVTGRDIGLSVRPDFERSGLQIDVLSIVRLKTSHIIVKSAQMILWFRRAIRMLK